MNEHETRDQPTPRPLSPHQPPEQRPGGGDFVYKRDGTIIDAYPSTPAPTLIPGAPPPQNATPATPASTPTPATE
jgi:hypothetical protein